VIASQRRVDAHDVSRAERRSGPDRAHTGTAARKSPITRLTCGASVG
jgi:hypothetical protein